MANTANVGQCGHAGEGGQVARLRRVGTWKKRLSAEARGTPRETTMSLFVAVFILP